MQPKTRSIRVKSPAKVNLYLRVVGRRPDGYHELDTIFQAIDLQDELLIERATTATTLEAPGFPELESDDNLIVRALRWLERETAAQLPVRIRLTKRIPMAAGLGGGSSNAAAALLGISTLFGLSLPPSDLARAAVNLGADVPFFLEGGTAVGQGIGERLTAVSLPWQYELVLVNPGFAVSTRRVFQELSRGLTENRGNVTVWDVFEHAESLAELLHNDLQAVAERLYPEIRVVRDQLKRAGFDGVLMSGSGPTVFGIIEPAKTVARTIPASTGWNVFRVRPLACGVSLD